MSILSISFCDNLGDVISTEKNQLKSERQMTALI